MLKKIAITSHLNRPRTYPPGPHVPGPRNLSIKDGHPTVGFELETCNQNF